MTSSNYSKEGEMRVRGSKGEKGGEKKREREEGRDKEEGEGGDEEIQQGMEGIYQTRFIIPCTGPWRYSRDLLEGLVHLCKGISSMNNHHTICDCV